MSPVAAFAPNLWDVKVTSDGSTLPMTWQNDLIDVRVQRGVNSIGRAVLRFRDEGLAKIDSFAANFKFGAKIEIISSSHLNNRDVTLMSGEVVAREANVDQDGQYFSVTVHDAAAKLALSTVTISSLQSTHRDVLARMLQGHGLQLKAPQNGSQHEWMLHARTPLGIVQEIAEREGWDWIVTGNTLALWSGAKETAPDSTEVSAALGRELMSLSVRDSMTDVRDVKVRGWDHATAKELTADAKVATQRVSADFVSEKVGAPGQVLLGHVAVTDMQEAQRLAAATAGTGGRVVARGRGVVMGAIVPGGTLTVTEAGKLHGKYYVREVEHHFGLGGAWTEFVAGDRDATRLTDPWRRVSSSIAHTRFDRLTVAVVTEVGRGTKDKPAGAVKVKFVALDGGIASHWAMLVQHGAGKGRGLTVMPDVGDQVVIGFADGDLSRPLVIGSIYSNEMQPDLGGDLVDAEGRVAIQSLVSQGGDRIEMRADKQGKQHHVRIALAGENHRFRLGEDASELVVPAGVPITVSAGQSKIVLDGNGKITLEGTDIVLKATNSVDISGTSVKIAASGNAELAANGNTTIKGTATSVQSTAATAIKGAVVNIN